MTTKHEQLLQRLRAALEARGHTDAQVWLIEKSYRELRAIAVAVGVK
jgi:hypothetical protein